MVGGRERAAKNNHLEGGGVTGIREGWFFGGDTNIIYGQQYTRGISFNLPTGEFVAYPRVTANNACTSIGYDTVNGIAYISGNFTQVKGTNGVFNRIRLAAFDPATGDVLPWAPELANPASALIYENGTIYVVGSFSQAASQGGGFTTRNHAAAFDAAGVLLPWNPDISPIATNAVADANFIYICGDMTSANGGTPRFGIARFDKVTGTLDAWDPNATGPAFTRAVYGMAFNSDGSKLYVAGPFAGIGGGANQFLARIDTTTGLDDGFVVTINPGGGGYGVIFRDGFLYTTGNYITVNGQPRTGFAMLDEFGALQPLLNPAGSITGSVEIGSDTNSWWVARSLNIFEGPPSGFAPMAFPATQYSGDSTLNEQITDRAEINPNLVVSVGQFFRAGSVAIRQTAYYTGPVLGTTPREPVINFYLRKDGQTQLKWNQVFMDVDFNHIQVDGYNIYRSTNANLETFALVKTITSLDVLNNVDTMFTEVIEGFYAYQVTALLANKESTPVTAKQVNSAFGADFI